MIFNRKHGVVLAMLGCLLFALAACVPVSADAKRSAIIPRVAKGPVFDGVLGDPLWNRGALMSDFVSTKPLPSPIQQTTARLMYDSEYLYIGIKCYESDMSNMIATSKGWSSNIWSEDDLEIFFDTANARRAYYQLLRNSLGAYYDMKFMSMGNPAGVWNAHSIIKTGRFDGGWSIEMAVPFSELGGAPVPGQVWSTNFCRGRQAGRQEYSSWNPSPSGFQNLSDFGEIIFGDESGTWNGIRLESWGGLDPENNPGYGPSVVCSIPNHGDKEASFNVSLFERMGGKLSPAASMSRVIQPGETAVLSLPYRSSSPDVDGWVLKVESGGKNLFQAEHEAVTAKGVHRVWKVEDPLYKELLSKTPPGLQKFGAIYWVNTYQPSLDVPFGEEYGIRYSSEEALKEFADSKLLPIMATGQFDDEFMLEMADKYRFKVLFYPDIRHWSAPDAPKIGDVSYMLDPRSRETYFKDLKSSLVKWRKYIWGVYSGDEFSEYAVYQTIRLNENYRNEYPFIRQIDEEVKQKYGFGKYGIPESTNDENPYRWIAVRRWVTDYIIQWQKDVYQTVHEIAPELRVISIDPVAGHKPVAWDRMAPYFDVATQQLYPPVDPNRQQFGFTTKMVADLTGKPTWPCTHVEHYAFSTTVDEVRELMSEVMRNGGKGFHFWLKDEIGNNAPNGFLMATKWGSPERWRTITEINKLNGRMNEVAVPKDADSAIFYSEDHYQSFSEKVAPFPYVYPNEPEWAYTFFGPVARTWFKFVNDNMVEDRKVDFSKFKAVIVPAAKYERKSVSNALFKYAAAGGTLVIGDAEAFSFDVNGDSLSALWSKYIPRSEEPGKEQTGLTFSDTCSIRGLRNRSLKVMGRVIALKPSASSEVLARFSDGTPAVIRTKLGRGSVIVFACNPFTETGIGDPDWKDFFKAFAKDLGLKTDRDIWRFEFPMPDSVYQPEPQGTCLTGNYIKWWQDGPVDVHNSEIAGSYSYSVQPDLTGDRATTFRTGKLTDRTKAYTTLKTELRPEDFIVTWKTEKPVDVTFDLLEPRDATRLHLYYTGQLPDFKVLGSADGTTWTQLAQSTDRMAKETGDVLDISVNLEKSKSRYVRLSLGARNPGNTMTLVECEIWGDTQ